MIFQLSITKLDKYFFRQILNKLVIKNLKSLGHFKNNEV